VHETFGLKGGPLATFSWIVALALLGLGLYAVYAVTGGGA